MNQYITSTGTAYEMEHGELIRVFTDTATGQRYEMRVRVLHRKGEGKRYTIIGLMNGEIAYNQTWLIDVLGALRYSALGYMPNVQSAISGAFDGMMQKLPK